MKHYLAAVFTTLSLSVSAATLEFNDGIRVVAINGQAISSQQHSQISLVPGSQVIAVQYHELFEYGFEQHEFVRSDVHIVKFDALTNQHYRLTLPEMTVEQARRFAKQPQFALDGSAPVAIEQFNQNQLISMLLKQQ